ncbi:MAG: TerB N-terminal domain-containing protein [Deltaproteobacteria bacterium]|nr:TerB N-terminal domain-containing protein [Deltaproteobacteria bacterium]
MWLCVLVGVGLLVLVLSAKKKPSRELKGSRTPRTVRNDQRRSSAHVPVRSELQSDLPEVRVTVTFGNADEARELAAPAEARWIGTGTVTIVGRTISNALIYVGKGLPSASGHRLEPALVDPRLPVHAGGMESNEEPGYWPSYRSLTPRARGVFLDWLAGGRSDPNANLGLVFTFFYGLERRALHDVQHDRSARADLPVIRAEVERLRRLYGQSGSFEGYSSRFLEALDALENKESVPPFDGTRSRTLPLGLEVQLGRALAKRQPLPGELAFEWVCHEGTARLGMPAERCASEFRALFLQRYRADFGAGLEIEPPARRLQHSYHAASAGFGNLIPLPLPDVPDVGAVGAPLKKVILLAERCAEDLGAYSRWLSKPNRSRSSPEAIALLPEDAAERAAEESMRELREWLSQRWQSETYVVVEGAEWTERWSALPDQPWSKQQVLRVLQALQGGGIGVEPDVRWGGTALDKSAHVCLFRIDTRSSAKPTAKYRVASLLGRLACAVVCADGVVTDREREAISRFCDAQVALPPESLTRLRAHCAWLLAETPKLGGLRSRLRELPATARNAMGRSVARLAGASDANPQTIRMVEQIYRLLELDPKLAFSELHGALAASEPVTVRTKGHESPGFAIPEMPPALGSTLDMQAVEEKLAESEQVASLLGEIFAGDDVEGPTPPPMAHVMTASGLDQKHLNLLKALAQNETWQRESFESLAREHGVMPDGALELLNDAAVEACGTLLCDPGETLTIDLAVAKEMLA